MYSVLNIFGCLELFVYDIKGEIIFKGKEIVLIKVDGALLKRIPKEKGLTQVHN